MSRTALALALLVTGVAVGCESSDDAPPATRGTPHTMRMPGGEEDLCPMYVKGALVVYDSVDEGAAIVFTAPDAAAADLRQRVRAMADHYRAHGMSDPSQQAPAPRMKVDVEDVDGGARIVFRARSRAQTGLLRAHVRLHADRLGQGSCAMERPPG